jgi:hypothetical protein
VLPEGLLAGERGVNDEKQRWGQAGALRCVASEKAKSKPAPFNTKGAAPARFGVSKNATHPFARTGQGKPSGEALPSRRAAALRASRVKGKLGLKGWVLARILGVGLGGQGRNGVFLTEIPAAVIYSDGRDLLGRKRHFSVTANLDDTAFAGNYLVKNPAVLQGDGNDLISGPGMAVPPEIICPFDGYWC